jgi:membrane protein required for colicin V production
MEIYDVIMLAILVGAVVFGAVKGMAWQLATIAALVVSYLVALRFSDSVAQYITVAEPLNKLAAMLILYLATSLVIWIGFGFVRSYIEKMALKDFDRHAGAILGAITGIILCVTVTLFSVTLLNDDQRQYVTKSKSGMHITRWINEYESMFPPAVHQVLAPYIERLNQEMGYRADRADLPPPRPGT